MVSIRRRKLSGRCNGFAGRSSFLLPLRSIPNGNVPENPGRSSTPANALHIPSVAPNQPNEVKEEKEIIASPPAKKQKTHVQIDPENPMEVHAYLMKLKEDNKLELGPWQRSEEMSVKEWMEKCYPHIFRVFPQNPKVSSQFIDKSMQNDSLYCNYWLFLFEVRNIVLMDYSVSPEYVESLGNVIKILEMEGFDCRFMRSEMLVVENMMKKQQEIMLAERNVIAKRIENFEKELLDLATKKEKESELDRRGKQIEERRPEIEMPAKQVNKLLENQSKAQRELNNRPYTALEQEFFEVILESHKGMLAWKKEEGKRLDRVLEKINLLHRY
ncbi:hypothetical protein JCGZ_15143 [Jatropha curcas]|uniref:Uncharacterized protein n=1 Tax=Jatropha curcas TaxID=180498 RepID=A0A067LDJ4_JATCU|nr:hypothetical protein JCGZ_15143 [Jatropha curcas]